MCVVVCEFAYVRVCVCVCVCARAQVLFSGNDVDMTQSGNLVRMVMGLKKNFGKWEGNGKKSKLKSHTYTHEYIHLHIHYIWREIVNIYTYTHMNTYDL